MSLGISGLVFVMSLVWSVRPGPTAGPNGGGVGATDEDEEDVCATAAAAASDPAQSSKVTVFMTTPISERSINTFKF